MAGLRDASFLPPTCVVVVHYARFDNETRNSETGNEIRWIRDYLMVFSRSDFTADSYKADAIWTCIIHGGTIA